MFITPYDEINEFMICASIIGFLLFFIVQLTLCSKTKNSFIMQVPLHMLVILLLAMACVIIMCSCNEWFKSYIVAFGTVFISSCVLGVALAWLCYAVKKAISKGKNKNSTKR